MVFVEKDDSAVNKKDKYAKQQRDQQCDNNNQDKLDETCTTCDTTLDRSKEDGAAAEPKIESQDSQNSNDDSQSHEIHTQEIMSSVLATMWMGDEHGNIYVHSSVDNWAQCLHTVKLKDAVIAIV